MKMYFDKFSEIGSTHKENEDFSVIGDEENPFVIVSDGCSGSKNTGTGSRILSLSASKLLTKYGVNSINDPDSFGFNMIIQSGMVAENLGLNQECLDATLAIITINKGMAICDIWGDGEIIIGRRNGSVENIKIEYTPEMPYYLSYSADKKRDNEYLEFIKNGILKKSVIENDRIIQYSPMSKTNRAFDIELLDYILISTDGIGTFPQKQHNEVVKEITSFKRLNGEFLGRRMNRMMRDNAKNKISHYDDFTIAGISFIRE